MSRLSLDPSTTSLPPSTLPPSTVSRRTVTKVVPSAAGTTVQALRSALQEILGERVFSEAMASVRPDLREAFEPLTPMTWVPVDVIHAVIARVAEQADRSFDELMDEAVQKAGERTLRSAWRMLLRVTSDRALMSRAPVLYSKWRNIGRLEPKVVAVGRVDLTLTEWPGMSERSIRSLAITIETVMRLAGRKEIKVVSQSTLDGAKYSLTWKV